jgi:hypothetical protein
MKAGLATSLSIAGVLATGGAALVLNSSILDTASTTKGSPALATVVGLNDQSTGIGTADAATGGSVTASGLADVVNGVEAPLSVDDPAPVVAAGSTATSPNTTMPEKQNGSVDASQSVTQSAAEPAVDGSAANAAPIDKQFTIDGIATVTLTAANGRLTVKSIELVSDSGYKVGNRYSHDGDDVHITFTSSSRAVEFSARLVRGQIVAAVGTPRNGNLMPPPGDDYERHERDEHDGDHEEHERENDDD